MLLNLSNHPFAAWQPAQIEAALGEFGAVEDLPFPHIDPSWSSETVQNLARDY
jgi:hypothetical protein